MSEINYKSSSTSLFSFKDSISLQKLFKPFRGKPIIFHLQEITKSLTPAQRLHIRFGTSYNKRDNKENTHEARKMLSAKILWSTLHEQVNEVQNKTAAFLSISLLWHLKSNKNIPLSYRSGCKYKWKTIGLRWKLIKSKY